MFLVVLKVTCSNSAHSVHLKTKRNETKRNFAVTQTSFRKRVSAAFLHRPVTVWTTLQALWQDEALLELTFRWWICVCEQYEKVHFTFGHTCRYLQPPVSPNTASHWLTYTSSSLQQLILRTLIHWWRVFRKWTNSSNGKWDKVVQRSASRQQWIHWSRSLCCPAAAVRAGSVSIMRELETLYVKIKIIWVK
jgi:hypothetical protein